MEEYQAATYGDRIADVYDQWVTLPADTDAAVEFLASLAGAGSVLELGIGTGRIALPLAERGIAVHGIDASTAMVAKLRAKPGGDAIPVVTGDFAEVSVQGSYRLVFVVFNTFFALASQEDQVRCFQNVARHLAADGAFVIQAFVPDLTRFDHGQRTSVREVQTDRVIVEVACHDPVQQRVSGQHIVLRESGITLYPVAIRYAWPAELDLMARLAGLRLRERWESWQRVPFTASSGTHVSVYAAAHDQPGL
jgi:SAM-dependent methyltransferase